MSLEDATYDVELRKFKERILARNVARGAELLDEILPGWAKAINVRLLSLATPYPHVTDRVGLSAKAGHGCILCQLDVYLYGDDDLPSEPIPVDNFGSYTEAAEALSQLDQFQEYPSTETGYFGFDLYEPDDYDYIGYFKPSFLKPSDEYKALDELWKEEIQNRL